MMQRVVFRKDTFVIQVRFLFWWVDEQAVDDYGNEIPCIYAFATFEEAEEHLNKEYYVHSSAFKEICRRYKYYV